MREFLFGRIALQVCRKDTTPLLLLQPMTSEQKLFTLRRILVPLDSESIHDDSLPMAKNLAKAYGAELYLLCVIPTFSTLAGEEAAASSLLPGTANAFLDIKENQAREHMQGHLSELIGEGFFTSAEISRRGPPHTTVYSCETTHARLILL